MRRFIPAALVCAAVVAAWIGVAADTQRGAQPVAKRPHAPARAAVQAPRAEAPAPVADFASPPPGARSPRNASYVITVRLDPVTRTLAGQEILTWRNISRTPATELRFHLYYNAWKNTRSTWLGERALSGRVVPAAREDEWGWTDLTAIRRIGPEGAPVDLTSVRRYVAPDDGNAEDQTVLSVPLPEPVEPGSTVNVAIDWTAKVPRTFSRTGTVGQAYFLAQWFPKIGVLEDAGWNCHQFHSGTEFFADYGVYDVSMTVPRGWIVGATGRERERRDGPGNTRTYRYVEEDVHDFAWTTSPDYLEQTARFQYGTLPPVEMRLLLQPEHVSQADRYFAATRACLRYYGEWLGAYPYGHLTIVDPAWQLGAGGMEYPTLFTGGTRWLAPKGVNSPEMVTVHECGHQFWYGLVGNNEFEDAWLDEGLNSYSTARVLDVAYPRASNAVRFFGGFVPVVLGDLPEDRVVDGDGLPAYRMAARSDVPSTPSFRYWPSTGGALSYDKTALWLHTLENHLGWPVFRKCLAAFFDRWKFRHPKPKDFFDVVHEVSGRDLSWFFDQVYRGSRVFDYGVDRLTSAPAAERGIFDRGGRRQFVDASTPGRWRTVVVVRRYQDGVFPVELEVSFADGKKVREQWDGRDSWKSFVYDRPARAESAVVDPGRVLVLDVNRTNNSRVLNSEAPRAATRWAFTWMVWLQDLLLTYAYFV